MDAVCVAERAIIPLWASFMYIHRLKLRCFVFLALYSTSWDLDVLATYLEQNSPAPVCYKGKSNLVIRIMKEVDEHMKREEGTSSTWNVFFWQDKTPWIGKRLKMSFPAKTVAEGQSIDDHGVFPLFFSVLPLRRWYSTCRMNEATEYLHDISWVKNAKRLCDVSIHCKSIPGLSCYLFREDDAKSSNRVWHLWGYVHMC